MTALGEFKNQFGERFVLSREGAEVFVTGDEFGWEPNNIALLESFCFSEEEKTQIDKIIPLIWHFSPELDGMPCFIKNMKPSRREVAKQRLVERYMRGLLADGHYPEATHCDGSWIVWDTAEQEEFLLRSGDSISMAQYALMRGFPSPEEGAPFLHRYAEVAGCSYVTHLDKPQKCWFGDYRQSMAEWLGYCDEIRQRRNQKLILD